MRPTACTFLAEACGGTLCGDAGQTVYNVKIDSRETAAGDLFVAVRGPANDGHRYLQSAYERGCRVFLVSDEAAGKALLAAHEDCAVIFVENTQDAFEQMAKAYTGQFDLLKIGVTGSTGKTSTKALTAAVMSAKYKTVCSQKNYNTHLGISLTCFLADETTQVLVLEMGMDRPDELHDYCSWVRPHAAIITNVGVVHMEYIGSREGIAAEKLKITDFLQPGQPLFCNCDSPFLSKEEILKRSSGRFDIVPAGEGPEALIKISDIEDRGLAGIAFTLSAHGETQRFELPFAGAHNAHNAALAAACGLRYGISLAEAAKAMPLAKTAGKRLEICRLRDAVLLDDSYNANPDSMASALRTLAAADAKRRIAVISTMRELGDAEKESHIAIGKLAKVLGLDFLVAIGADREYYAEGCNAQQGSTALLLFDTWQNALPAVEQLLQSGDCLLVKGSLSTEIHCLAEKLREKYTE